MSVDFEVGENWVEKLTTSGFDIKRPAVVACTGVSMYLTREAVTMMLRQIATFAPGSTLVLSFLLPIEWMDPSIRPGMERAIAGAQASGTPFVSFFTPEEMLALAWNAGFKNVQHVSAEMLTQLYFTRRSDGLRPPSHSEELLIART